MANHAQDDSLPGDLAHFDHAYAQAPTTSRKESYNEAIPDGHYTVLIRDVELTRTRQTGNPMLRWDLEITGPTMMGRRLFKNSVITDRSLPYVKMELLACGLELMRLSELPDHLSELIDMELEVTKRTTERGDNVYLNKRIDKGYEAGGSEMPF